MYVKIDTKTYAKIRNLVYAPETDVTGSAVPINEFSVDVVTADSITIGQYAELYDDLDALWAKYWIVYAEHTDANTVQIRARSDIALLDGVTLPAVMYSGESVSNVLDDTMVRQAGGGLVATVDYSLDNSFAGVTITGFCPEQSARERLQWVCFILGAYVKTFFNDEIEILPIDTTTELVPIDRTFWKPSVTYKDYVTGVRVIAYSFTQGTPATTDTWVTDGTNYYIVTEQAFTVANSAAPASAADNIVEVSGVYLVNSNNVSALLTHLSLLYFKRTEVELDVINNAAYEPGDKLTVYADESTMFSGFAKSCAFEFGLQARSHVVLTAGESTECALLTIVYMWDTLRIGGAQYMFPIGYSYAVQNLFADWTMGAVRYIFRPTTAQVTGTMVSGGVSETVNYAEALVEEEGILEIVSVDDLILSDGVVIIA